MDDPILALLDEFVPWAARDELFHSQAYSTHPSPSQGWKLHVSATPVSAPAVLAACLPVLLEAGIPFKVVSGQRRLLELNNGGYGESQVGKFITVYPPDDDHAVALAERLHSRTAGMRGPQVRSDLTFRPKSLVHYRYGAFQRRARPPGEPRHECGDLLDTHGRWIPDLRDRPGGGGGADAPNPFAAEGGPDTGSTKGPLAGRFLVVDVLATSAYGAVYRAIDLNTTPARPCVLKEFWRDAGGDEQGRLAPDWGADEAAILRRHPGQGLPECYATFELDDNFYLVLEYVEGPTLAAELSRREDRLDGFTVAECVRIGSELCSALEELHAAGVIVRDLNPSNVVLHDGGCRIVDLGIAYDAQAPEHVPNGLGTADYCSPQQWALGPATPTDDVYSWGAVMHSLLCGTRGLELSRDQPPPWPPRPVRRLPVGELAPGTPTSLAELVDRAVSPEATHRFGSVREVLDVLDRITDLTTGDAPAALHVTAPVGTTPDPLDIARKIGDRLVEAAVQRDGGACWPTEFAGGTRCSADLYHGAAGIGLYLAALGRHTGDETFSDTARAAARWLSGPPWSSGRGEPGLYVGESGLGLFFLRLAELLGEPAYERMAELRAQRTADLRPAEPDLTGGRSGQLVFLVALKGASPDDKYLDAAEAIAAELATEWRLDDHRHRRSTEELWRRSAVLGLAHGAAGVGLSLLIYADASGATWAHEAAVECGRRLVGFAEKHPDGGLVWPEAAGRQNYRVQAQCHGAVGIGRFLLRLSAEDGDEFAEAAAGAAVTAQREAPRRPSSSLCHGVAGDGLFFLECATVLGPEPYFELARQASRVIDRHRRPGRSGSYTQLGSSLDRPELLVGDAGVGWFHLALAAASGSLGPLGDPVLGLPRKGP